MPEVQATTQVQQPKAATPKPTTAERVVTTFAPLGTAGYLLAKGLVNGKNFEEACTDVGDHFEAVH